MNNGLEAMRRHQGRKEKFYLSESTIDVEGKMIEGDYIELEPVKGDKAPELLTLMMKMESLDKKNTINTKVGLGKEIIPLVDDILFQVVQKSIPNATEEEIKNFVQEYYLQLFTKVMAMNIPK